MQLGIADVLLLAGGIISLLIVCMYRKDKESGKYKAVMVLGFLIGVAIIAVGAIHYSEWTTFDMVLIFLAAFALVIRPFRKTEIAIIAAVIVMIAVYLYAGTLTGDWEVLSEGTPRIIVAVVAGAFVYMVLNFIEKLADLLGKFLNLWPVLAILGIICIAEAVLLIVNGTSIFDYVEKYRAGETIIAALMC
ncbi:MAG: hypothetical protein J5707_03385 [Candidatus Methanomethylophilus sp.]|nr:hypothetical protein [Methanomethylophilus sp.]